MALNGCASLLDYGKFIRSGMRCSINREIPQQDGRTDGSVTHGHIGMQERGVWRESGGKEEGVWGGA